MPKCACGGSYLIDAMDDLNSSVVLAVKCSQCSYIYILIGQCILSALIQAFAKINQQEPYARIRCLAN